MDKNKPCDNGNSIPNLNTQENQSVSEALPVPTENSNLGFFNNVLTSNPYFSAGFGLMALGVVLATAQRGLKTGSSFLYRQMFVDLEIPSKDKAYDWVLEWMTRQTNKPVSLESSKSFNTSLQDSIISRLLGRKHLSVQTLFKQHDNGSVTTSFSIIPGPGHHIIKYKGAFIRVSRERSGRLMDLTHGTPFETVTLKTLYRDRHLFQDILSEARTMAVQLQQGKTVIFTSFGPEWRPFGLPRRKRPLNSVILDKGVSENIVSDVKDFISSSQWYIDRGVPYRRGYLLYGPPGSGKSSFIQALAGELDYNICILNLAEPHLTDDRLNHLMNHIPERSLLLLEDIDAAFTTRRTQTEDQGYASGVTFSGLLNALDGVASSEERLIFMTTNHIERLDPALKRPGRVDMQEYIGNASDYQIKVMFNRFYFENKTIEQEGPENEICLQFLKHVKALDRPVSTAELQGLFVYNKENPEGAINMVPLLATKL